MFIYVYLSHLLLFLQTRQNNTEYLYVFIYSYCLLTSGRICFDLTIHGEETGHAGGKGMRVGRHATKVTSLKTPPPKFDSERIIHTNLCLMWSV